MITSGTFYQDLGADYFEHRTKPTQTKRLVAKPQSLDDVETQRHRKSASIADFGNLIYLMGTGAE